MDYDTYGSSAVELAIELANADRTDAGLGAGLPGRPRRVVHARARRCELSPGETHKAGATAELVRAVALAETQDDVLDPAQRAAGHWPGRAPTPPTTTASCTCTTPAPTPRCSSS